MARARRLHHSLWIRQQPWRICALPLLRYSELLLARIANFFWAVAAWTLIFTAVFYYAQQIRNPMPERTRPVLEAFATMMSAVLGADVKGNHILSQLTMVAAMLIGIAHFGLLIAHLYSIAARK
jgi:hypothetical protein